SLCRIAARQVRAHLAPARAAIGCLQHHLRAQVEHLRILRRKDQRRSPGETVVALGDFRAKIFRRRRRNGLRLTGAQVVANSAVGWLYQELQVAPPSTLMAAPWSLPKIMRCGFSGSTQSEW